MADFGGFLSWFSYSSERYEGSILVCLQFLSLLQHTPEPASQSGRCGAGAFLFWTSLTFFFAFEALLPPELCKMSLVIGFFAFLAANPDYLRCSLVPTYLKNVNPP